MIAACTIVAGNYLAAARVLGASLFAQHPDASFAVLVVDDEQRELATDEVLDSRIEWWRLADLGLDTDEIHRLAAIYDVTELSTSVKPLFLRHLLRARQAPVIYLDPDIVVFASLEEVPALAHTHGLVLTPHVTQAIPDDGRGVDALFVLAAGMYNLGFIAVAPQADDCLLWWWQQTRRRALNDVKQQMFTDQRWADYMPSLFGHHLLKDPGYNVAYWNLHERPVTRVDGRLYARDMPLRFFHFSGFDPDVPWLLSRHQGDAPRIILSNHPVLADLCEEYASSLRAAGDDRSRRRPYGWDHSADELALSGVIRRLYWSALMEAERAAQPEPPNPFDSQHPAAFTEWLNTADEGAPRRWSRYVDAIYRGRPDVEAHIADIDGRGADQFAAWLQTDGVAQEHIPSQLLPPHTARTPRVRRSLLGSARTAPAPGVNITGYFRAELGVGEAGRLLTRAVEATGSAFTTHGLHAPLSRQGHPFLTSEPVGEGPFDINLLCMNADVTSAFAKDVGPAFFENRYTIGYWFWEVDPLPPGMNDAFRYVDEVWTASDYVANIVRAAAGRTPVFTVPLPLLPPSGAALSRDQLGLPIDPVLFLFSFDFLSVVERKNPHGLIEAFRRAFAPGRGALLIIKTMNGDARISELEQLRRAAADRPDIIIRDGYATVVEKDALMAACDCYVSLHRAEGLGLTMAEAMALGKPVIATGYSGNLQFMTAENSLLVGFQMTDVPVGCGPYPAGARWADPDLDEASRLMRAVYDRTGEAATRAARGREELRRLHNVAVSAAAVSSRLAQIRRRRTMAPVVTAARRWGRAIRRVAARVVRPR